jgi:hypothetical protein
MRKGFLGSLAGFFVGAGLGLAQTPATGNIQPAGEPVIQAAADAPIVPLPHSPYWPNPAAKLDCAGPYAHVELPAPICGPDFDSRERVWASADYLVWWVKSGPDPIPLVTTSSAASLGILGAPDTTVVAGGSGFDYKAFSGAELAAGFWFNRDRDCGFEGTGFFLEDRPARFSAHSSGTGSPLFARPVVNALTGAESAELISDPGVASGAIAITSYSSLYGFDTDLVARVPYSGSWQVDYLAGFRFVSLSEQVNIDQATTLLPGGAAGFVGGTVTTPSTVGILDRFSTHNEFYGGEIGARVEFGGPSGMFVRVTGKLAVGDSHENLNVAGYTSTGPGIPPAAGGLLALSSNIGKSAHDEFAVIPEIGIRVGYAFTPMVKISMGYNFLYWSDVVRPGDQMSRTVNPALIPSSTIFGLVGGPASPSPTFNRTEFWAQGINVGLELRY